MLKLLLPVWKPVVPAWYYHSSEISKCVYREGDHISQDWGHEEQVFAWKIVHITLEQVHTESGPDTEAVQ